MSIIQHHTAASLSDAWRTVNIDILTEDSSVNFDTSTLRPPQPEIAEADVRALASQVRQLLRGGDAEGALRGCLETPVYNGTDAAKEAHLQTIIEVLHYKGMASGAPASAVSAGLKSPAKMTPQSTGFSQIGSRPGVSNEPASAAMSVLLSWHEKLVEVAGLGCIGRTMTDWRRV
ncbi:Arp2/3 complex 16 kDa subunit ARPC5 [Trichoderma citrinoviride]|uniref:Actin-related protein 2/3 complex subunit 5 n=1 Tax=Trichoderma citrinoviride TaxID=58853 RepID=A0A2T4BNV6_9HYPO|nr:Arp2/3 complex 16 kDa subunit ARPC5 [Trichoderma citrinoviride]PTB70966.1 Arp2/3 complex 16 kDa subunit ARPC5 [Trichoderma citrinoviride]